jgi:hypothetical protein
MLIKHDIKNMIVYFETKVFQVKITNVKIFLVFDTSDS